MNGLSILAVVLAIVTTLITWVDFSGPEQMERTEEAKLLNTDPEKEINVDAIKSLRVVRWNEEQGSNTVFAVAFKDGQWLIPSHYDYPADEGSRVGQTVGSVINVEHGPLVSADPQQHAELGVLDPLQEDGAAQADSGYGERVTLEGDGGQLLLDLIIGKRSESADVYYVRRAGEAQVYTAKVNLSLSTKFKDWVETDLLKVAAGDVRGIYIQDYSVNEKTQRLEQRAETGFDRLSAGHDWTTEQLPKGKMVSKDKVDGLVSTATSIRLIDVQPFKEHLLQTRGFIINQDGRVFGNEGAVMLTLSDGLIYYLFFGEIAVDEDQKEGEAAADNRYMAVFVRYDENKDQTLQDLMRRQQEEAAQKNDAAEKADEAEAEKAEKVEKAGEQAEPKVDEQPRDFVKEIAERKAACAQKAEQKQARFSKFFYVIDDASFKRLRPSREDLFIDPPKETKDSKKK